jgi:hypothetical protein
MPGIWREISRHTSRAGALDEPGAGGQPASILRLLRCSRSSATFCGHCGRPLASAESLVVALRSQHESRTTNNEQRIVHSSQLPTKLRRLRLWLLLAGVIVLASTGLGITANVLRPQPLACMPPQCVIRPPSTAPLSPDATYTSSTYGFSLDYLQDYRPGY